MISRAQGMPSEHQDAPRVGFRHYRSGHLGLLPVFTAATSLHFTIHLIVLFDLILLPARPML